MKNLKRMIPLYPLLTGVLLGISFPFTGSLFPLAFVALVPLLLYREHVSEKKFAGGRLFLQAYLTFIVYNAITTWWIYNADPIGCFLAIFANALLMAVPWFAYHYAAKYLGLKRGLIGLFFFWLAFEYGHYHWELSWPWLSFGNVFSRVPQIVQWYSLSGVTGGTAWILLVNILVFVYLKTKRKGVLALDGLVIVLPIMISLISYYSWEQPNTEKYLNVAIIQPNVDAYKKYEGGWPSQMNTIADLAMEAPDTTELFLVPETAISAGALLEGAWGNYSLIWEKLNPVFEKFPNSSMIIGATTYKDYDDSVSIASRKMRNGKYREYYNTALLLNKYGVQDVYHKSELVLGVEKIPFLSMIPKLGELAMDLGGATGQLGVEKEPRNFDVNGVQVSPLICYESVYGSNVADFTRNGADVIGIITNDAWWYDTPGYKQHFSFARLRAIENDRYVVRSANTGFSGVINARGEVIEKSKWWEEKMLFASVPVLKDETTFVFNGDMFGRVSVFTAIAMLIYTLVHGIKRTREEQH